MIVAGARSDGRVVYCMSKIDAGAHVGARGGQTDAIGGAVGLRKRNTRWHRPVGGRLKRSIDMVLAAMTLLVLAPMFLFIAALLRAGLGRPVLAAEEHVGFGGRAFTAYKFRTSPNDGARKLSGEATSTSCLSRVLRDSRLDRLPQLISILRGDMSLVGPRPIRFDRSGHGRPDYFASRPGLISTFWADRSGRLGGRRRAAMDRYYARRWTIWLDLAVFVGCLRPRRTEAA
jgi:exopolysaccharide production protein ExoY